VIGSGVSGGWAAKEFTARGLKTLLIDRGRKVEHGVDYVTEGKAAFELPYAGRWPPGLKERDYFLQDTSGPATYHYYNNDRLNPYAFNKDKPFYWMRTDIQGGKSVVWGRQSYRWSEIDFEANKADGHGIDWPIRYKDVAPWYANQGASKSVSRTVPISRPVRSGLLLRRLFLDPVIDAPGGARNGEPDGAYGQGHRRPGL
jgi:choline dehydrogenase-like flavoprotein